jgi:hypothetical protein
MSQRVVAAARRRRRLITYGWVSAMALVIIILIYKEQTALLYILATLGVTALLAVVAFADLHRGEGATAERGAALPTSAVSDSGAGAARLSAATRRRR